MCIPGAYIQRSNANTSLALNYPLAEAGLLEVFNISYSATESMLHQRYTRYGTTSGKDIQVWHRRYYATGGGWGPWVPIGGRHETAAPTTGLVNGSGGTFVAMDGLKVNDVYSGRTHCTINAARAGPSLAGCCTPCAPARSPKPAASAQPCAGAAVRGASFGPVGQERVARGIPNPDNYRLRMLLVTGALDTVLNP